MEKMVYIGYREPLIDYKQIKYTIMTETETVNARTPIEDSIKEEIGKATKRFDDFLTFAGLQKKNTKLKVSSFVSRTNSHRNRFRIKYAAVLLQTKWDSVKQL